MKQSDIQRYEKALLKEVPGLRLRKKVRAAFRASTQALLEEFPEPNYQTLLHAFGPPKSMAEELIHTIPNPPRPLSRKKKLGITAAICVLILAVALGLYTSWEVPESKVTISDGAAYTPAVLRQNYASILIDEFSHHNVTWQQSKEFKAYLILFQNTNQVPTSVEVRYSNHQFPHAFKIPAGEQLALLVEDARTTTHTVAFITDDGSLSGTLQVFVSPPN